MCSTHKANGNKTSTNFAEAKLPAVKAVRWLSITHAVYMSQKLSSAALHETFATFPLRKCVSNKVYFDNYVLRKKYTFVESELT